MTRLVLRAAAVAIAVAGVADPVITVSRVRPSRATIVTAVQHDREGEARSARENLTSAAGGGVHFTERGATGGRLTCAAYEPCVVIADGSVEMAIPPDRTALTSLIRIALPGAPNLSLSAVSAPSTQHVAAAGIARVEVEGVGVAGRRSDITVRDGDAIVGSASIEWKADRPQRVDVPWWPIADGPRRLSVSVAPIDGETSSADNAVDVGVAVSAERVPVLVFEPRPSWASTFVRRALESDPRWDVESRVRLGPILSSGTPATRLDHRALDRAALVVIGAPESLGSGDVALLDRYVRLRGGTLVVLPDRVPTGPVLSLLRGRWRERLHSAPEAVGPLLASELLIGDSASDLDTVLGGSQHAPTLLLMSAGAGRILVSGAMDAWRNRGTNEEAFDRFWSSIAADAAAHSASLTIDLSRSLAKPGDRVPFVVRWRTMDRVTTVNVRATVRCGGGPPASIRLWPTGELGVFSGLLAAGSASTCVIDAAIEAGPSATTGIVVADAPRRSVPATLADLDRLVEVTGGLSVKAGQEEQVAQLLTAAKAPNPIPTPVRPMQSPWWMFPFAAALGGEWWLRRRGGLR